MKERGERREGKDQSPAFWNAVVLSGGSGCAALDVVGRSPNPGRNLRQPGRCLAPVNEKKNPPRGGACRLIAAINDYQVVLFTWPQKDVYIDTRSSLHSGSVRVTLGNAVDRPRIRARSLNEHTHGSGILDTNVPVSGRHGFFSRHPRQWSPARPAIPNRKQRVHKRDDR